MMAKKTLSSILEETTLSPSTILSLTASIAASAVLWRSIAHDLIPYSAQDFLCSRLRKFSDRFSSQLTVVVDEFDGLTPNHLFVAANVYLGTKLCSSTRRIKVNVAENDNHFAVTIDKDEELVDSFEGVKFKWLLVCSPIEKRSSLSNVRDQNALRQSEVRHLEISFHKRHRDMVLGSYLPHILRRAKEIDREKRSVKLHTVDYSGTDYWGSINFDHPATFNTIAMEPEIKKELVEDLDRFISSKDFYRRVGRAWKRGYLLYGPPGTGKSSLVAAMANFLKFNIYDLDLKEVQCNSDLRRLLIGTGNRSILVIEDIDCSIELRNRDSKNEPGSDNQEDDKITLSGLLNFVDGLWSSCGEERIIVFTTNRKDQIDSALLRPGRMDLHIYMSYCTFNGFKILAKNYLGIVDHSLFAYIEELMHKVEVTPAEVAGELMKYHTVEDTLHGVLKFLQAKAH